MSVACRGRRSAGAYLYLASLLTVPLFFCANYIYHHQRLWLPWLPSGRAVYVLAILLPFGILLPGLALGGLSRHAHNNARASGVALGRRDLGLMLLALVIGGLIAVFPIGRKILQDPRGGAQGLHLFIWLLPASLAEGLVFIGVVFHVTERAIRREGWGRLGAGLGLGAGMVISAVAFGLFHFSYPAPWDTWAKVSMLVPVWLGVTLFYALTRSLAAAIVFNNVMAVIGFMQADLSLPGSDLLGVGLAVFVILAGLGVGWVGRALKSGNGAALPAP